MYTVLEDLDILGSDHTHLQVFQPVKLREVKRFIFFDYSICFSWTNNQDVVFLHKWNHILIIILAFLVSLNSLSTLFIWSGFSGFNRTRTFLPGLILCSWFITEHTPSHVITGSYFMSRYSFLLQVLDERRRQVLWCLRRYVWTLSFTLPWFNLRVDVTIDIVFTFRMEVQSSHHFEVEERLLGLRLLENRVVLRMS